MGIVHSEALLPVGTTDNTPRLTALQSPSHYTSTLCILKYDIMSINDAQLWKRHCKEAIWLIHILLFAAGSIQFHGAVQKTRGEICCCWKSQ